MKFLGVPHQQQFILLLSRSQALLWNVYLQVPLDESTTPSGAWERKKGGAFTK